MSVHVKMLIALFAFTAITPRAQSEDPARVRPFVGTVGKLRKASTEVADSLGKYLDTGHDWFYRRLQHFFEDIDMQFAAPEQAPILVPLSPLRIGFESGFVHRKDGLKFVATPDFEATLISNSVSRYS